MDKLRDNKGIEEKQKENFENTKRSKTLRDNKKVDEKVMDNKEA